ncbi:MAG: tetratricopeptide repeat protein [Pyrinomonadaceae bacterium]
MKIVFWLVLLAFTVLPVFSQEVNTKNLDDEIASAKKAVSAEKGNESSEKYLNAQLNYAHLLTEKCRFNESLLTDNTLSKNEKIKLRQQEGNYSDEALNIFVKLKNSYEKSGQADSLQMAAVENDLAWQATHNFRLIEREKTTLAVVKEANGYYKDALDIRAKLLGNDNDLTLATIADYGDFSLRWARFELALNLYGKYLELTENKKDADNLKLANVLNSYTNALAATDRETEAQEMWKKAAQISGQNAPLQFTPQDLAIRSDHFGVADDPFELELQRKFSRTGGGNFNNNRDISLIRPIIFAQSIPVDITVDEKGKVIETKTDGKDDSFKKDARENISKWKFVSFTENQIARKMHGRIYYLKHPPNL